MKKIIKPVIFNKLVARLIIKSILRLHNQCYILAGRYASILNDGIHPKHQILKYKEWFLDNINHDWTVLDIGCNTGMLPFLLSQKTAFVYGIEINKDYIETAKKQHAKKNIEYICNDATKYDYSKCRSIDCITLSNTLEHIDKRIDFLKQIISKINWADNNNRYFLFRVPVFDREWIVAYKKQVGVEYRLDQSHYIEYTLESFVEELRLAGIEILETQIRFGEIYAVCRAVV